MREIEISFGLLLSIGLLAMAGCAGKEPYRRADVWYPTGANAGNIAAMAADPNDLVRGRGTGLATSAAPAASAAERVRLDRPKALAGASGAAPGGGALPQAGGGS